jgi:hypothetical protein
VQFGAIWVEKAFYQPLADSAVACARRDDGKRPKDVRDRG